MWDELAERPIGQAIPYAHVAISIFKASRFLYNTFPSTPDGGGRQYPAEAVKLFRRAAGQGHADAAALCR